jgi:hypothetical protein
MPCGFKYQEPESLGVIKTLDVCHKLKMSVFSLLQSKYLVHMETQNKILPVCWIIMTEFPVHYYSTGADDKYYCYK